jgi:hypothetical protein
MVFDSKENINAALIFLDYYVVNFERKWIIKQKLNGSSSFQSTQFIINHFKNILTVQGINVCW